ncbi:AAA family ATPase [Antarcticirhabdus aurantiaca]|uniref:Zeta toxin family protein n=1 Tax=Antarcticirhabdus aurantiaca TaxID=2606717 RepID=A0ACD4NTY5_9HYPH|nr:AAA family ATPase [Antarcticirhabdus aurantiaca]WAJ30228.1 zeta toxin family protein [Jeongeuplla avenae]
MPSRKSCTLLAGPNGSGKSSIFETLKPNGVFVNADVVARRLRPDDPSSASLEAGREVLRKLEALRRDGSSFVYETTLSSRQSIALMEACRRDGYEVDLVFVILLDADLNIRRVAERVRRGGHDIPEPVIRRRYDASLRRLAEAIPLADNCLFFDNSETSPRLLLSIERGTVIQSDLDSTETLQARLVGIVDAALGTSVPTPPAGGSRTRR